MEDPDIHAGYPISEPPPKPPTSRWCALPRNSTWAPHTGPPVSLRRLASRAAKPRGQFRAESGVFRLCNTLSRSPKPVRDFEAPRPAGLFGFVSVRSTCSVVLSIWSQRLGSGRVAHQGCSRTYRLLPFGFILVGKRYPGPGKGIAKEVGMRAGAAGISPPEPRYGQPGLELQ